MGLAAAKHVELTVRDLLWWWQRLVEKTTVSDRHPLSPEEELEAEEPLAASELAPEAGTTDRASHRARREAWVARVGAVVLVLVLAIWAVRADDISSAPARYASGIVLSAVALGMAVLLAMRAGHFRVLAERAYLIELHQATSHARQQVLRDHLSGLYRRWFFCERLEQELARSARYGRLASVGYLSFPAWKTLSLATQAELIQRVGRLLQHDLRAGDVAARWGPGQFAWYLPETDAAQAVVAARRLAGAVNTTGAAIGVAQFPVDGSSLDELLRAAQGRARATEAA